MIGRILIAAVLGAGSCGSETTPPTSGSGRQGDAAPAVGAEERGAAPGVPRDEPREENDPDVPCTMAGECPSESLPRFDTALSREGWKRLRALARTRVVAVRIGADAVTLIDACQLPGRYHEVVPAPDSPGRAWASSRLVFTPSEVRDCGTATHAVAAFSMRDSAAGSAIALPLPCTSADGCIGAGLDPAARKAAAKVRWERAELATRKGNFREALVDLVEITALLPEAASYANLARNLKFLTSTAYGGCLWLSEAEMAAHGLDPGFVPHLDPEHGRPALQHEVQDCWTRPSFMTCFPEHFTPGEGGNCW